MKWAFSQEIDLFQQPFSTPPSVTDRPDAHVVDVEGDLSERAQRMCFLLQKAFQPIRSPDGRPTRSVARLITGYEELFYIGLSLVQQLL